MDYTEFSVGQRIVFQDSMPIEALRGVHAELIRKREYLFDNDTIESFIIKTQYGEEYGFATMRDDDIVYASISRELSTAERRAWFDPDALSFFLEKTSAQTLRCRASAPADMPWSADRYTKVVDLVSGQVMDTSKRGAANYFLYSMLIDASGERAIEIEQYQDHGIIRMHATVFIPLYAVSSLHEESPKTNADSLQARKSVANIMEEPPLFLEPLPQANNDNSSYYDSSDDDDDDYPAMSQSNAPSAQIIPLHDAFQALSDELQAMAEEEIEGFYEESFASVSIAKTQPDFKNDFRRLETKNEQRPKPLKPVSADVTSAPVPDFLLKPREEKADKSEQLFKKIFEPKASQILCDVQSAEIIKSEAARLKQSPQEIIRGMIGLHEDKKPPMAAFDLTLSEDDYARLAMRYQIRPDRKDEIRKRMSQELADALAQKAPQKTS